MGCSGYKKKQSSGLPIRGLSLLSDSLKFSHKAPVRVKIFLPLEAVGSLCFIGIRGFVMALDHDQAAR